jgi:signal transduction histidine kinase
MRPRLATITAALFGAAATLFLVFGRFVHFAYANPSGQLFVNTAASFIAFLAALLIFGRFRRSQTSRDASLSFALALFGWSSLFFAVIPELLGAPSGSHVTTWAPLGCGLLATILFAWSVLLGDRRLLRPPHQVGLGVLLGSLAVMAVIVVLLEVFGSQLPAATTRGNLVAVVRTARIEGHPLVLAIQLAQTVLFGLAAVGYTRKAECSSDELLKWIGAGAALAAFARLNYFLFPSLYSQYFYTGDVLRLGFYLLILLGAMREIAEYWSRLADASVFEERRRIARELHDGLAQELTFIVSQTQGEHPRLDPERVQMIAGAARRAMDESRLAIAALTVPLDQPLDEALAASAQEVAHRLGAHVHLDLQDGVGVSREAHQNLVRIVREAVTNAVRHGKSENVWIRMRAGELLELVVSDDGKGFDVEAAGRGPGFGLAGMSDRARGLGGRLAVDSGQEGTSLRISLPY